MEKVIQKNWNSLFVFLCIFFMSFFLSKNIFESEVFRVWIGKDNDYRFKNERYHWESMFVQYYW